MDEICRTVRIVERVLETSVDNTARAIVKGPTLTVLSALERDERAYFGMQFGLEAGQWAGNGQRP